MLVKMLETTKGSPNGIIVNEYKKDHQYDLPEKLRDAFIIMQVCEDVKKEKPKMVQAPVNKMAKEPENKHEDLEDDIDDSEEIEDKTKKRRRKN